MDTTVYKVGVHALFLLSLRENIEKSGQKIRKWEKCDITLCLWKLSFPLYKLNNFRIVQVLRDRELQGGRDRGEQAQGGHTPCRGRHQQVQEGEPHHVRLGDQGSAALRGRLQPGERSKCL